MGQFLSGGWIWSWECNDNVTGWWNHVIEVKLYQLKIKKYFTLFNVYYIILLSFSGVLKMYNFDIIRYTYQWLLL